MRRSPLYKLIDRYLNGKGTAEEIHFVQRYFHFLKKGYKAPIHDAVEKDRIKDEIKDNLRNQIELSDWKSLKRRKLKYYAVAASFMLVLTFGYYTVKTSHSTKQKNEFNNTLAAALNPIENKARLILEDGRVIQLDNGKEVVLFGHNETLIKKEIEGKENLISYELNQHEATAEQEVILHTMITPKGGRYTVQLADGSRVWLNSDSKLIFPANFSATERRVELVGEGYFEIAENKNKPFFIQAKGVEIEVLGTHFNVKAYEDEDYFRTTLLEGAIKLANNVEEAVLKPGEQVEQISGNPFVKKQVNVDEAVAWKQGYFYFKNDSLEEIMRMLSRNYDVDVEYQGDFTKMRFGGKVSINRPLSEVLEIIELTGSVHFEQEGRRLIVMN